MSLNSYTTRSARAAGYRSGFEADVANELTEKGIEFEYESKNCKFVWHKHVPKAVLLFNDEVQELSKGHRIVQECTYTCDFRIPKKDGTFLYIETKGRFQSSDRTKHEALKKQFPDLDLRILFGYNGKATPKLSYLQWCNQKDIVAATIIKPTKKREGRMLPAGWLKDAACDFDIGG